MWKDVVVGYIEALSRHWRGVADGNNGYLKNSRSRHQDLNSGPPKYEVGMLPIQPRRSYDACLTKLTVVYGKYECCRFRGFHSR
jgi:hypothetical protein